MTIDQGKFYKIQKKNEILYLKINRVEFLDISETLFASGNCLSILLFEDREDFEMYSEYEISNKDKTIIKIEEITYEQYKEAIMSYSIKLM